MSDDNKIPTEAEFLEAARNLYRAAAEVGVVPLLVEHLNEFAEGLAVGVMAAGFARALKGGGA